ncbi:MAG: universal stress protein [Pseudobdellovibrionaceae bacterium]
MISRTVLVADDLGDSDSLARKRSELIQRFASDFSVLTQTATDLVYVHPTKDFAGKKIPAMDKNIVIKADYEKYHSVIHNFTRPGKFHVKLGWPIHEIVKTMEETRPEALIMGTKSHPALDRFFLGSVAEEVVRAVKRPVIVFGPEAQKKEFRLSDHKKINFLVATDLTKKCRPMETYAVSLAKRIGASVFFYYSLADTIATAQTFAYGSGELFPTFSSFTEDIKRDAYASMEKKVARLRQKGLDCDFHIENHITDFGEALLKNKKADEMQLVFMGHHSQGSFVSSILGSNLRVVIAKAKVPVVVVR